MRTSQGNRRTKLPGTLIGLDVILGLLAVGSVQGGIAMLLDPLEPLGMSTDFLEGTPVDTYLWPGIFLLGMAAASVVTLVGLLLDWRWAWASTIEMTVGHKWPWLGALLTGGVLLSFELIELFVVPFQPIMHPLLIAMSVTIIALALSPSASRHLLSETRQTWAFPSR